MVFGFTILLGFSDLGLLTPGSQRQGSLRRPIMLSEMKQPMELSPCLRESGDNAVVRYLCFVSICSGMGRGEWKIYLRYFYQDILSELVIQFLIIAAAWAAKQHVFSQDNYPSWSS